MDTNYNIIRIQRYLQGQLSPEEMYSLEREALDDPFLNDAIEGYRLQDEINHGKLSLLQQRLAARIENQRQERDRFFFGGQRLGIAATACVLFLLVVLLYWMRTYGPVGSTVEGQDAGAREIDVELPVSESSSAGSPDIRVSPLHLAGAVVAEPVGGWETFNAYIRQHTEWSPHVRDSLPPAGTHFSVEFTITPSGRPESIRVDTVTTTGPVPVEVRQEIIRLLETGPSWQRGRKVGGDQSSPPRDTGQDRVTLQVEF